MKLKNRFVYIAITCIITLICYMLIGEYILDSNSQLVPPENTFVHEDAPTEEEIQADLVGKRISLSRGGTRWFQVTTMGNFFEFNIEDVSHYSYIVEYKIDVALTAEGELFDQNLHLAYRKTDTGWDLVSIHSSL